jgi:hypothetical protein
MRVRPTQEITCSICQKPFMVENRCIKDNLKRGRQPPVCSITCRDQQNKVDTHNCNCAHCHKPVRVTPCEHRKSKSGRSFCDSSCAAFYNNTHKTAGTRRSKLEKWLEIKLTSIYHFDIAFNRKDAINSELDIYIPSLKLAFELNGIFHYEPIYGSDKLARIQNNDSRKFQACIERGIELCIIDTSRLKYFKEQNAEPYFRIISDIITTKSRGLDSNKEPRPCYGP